jgi:hypothetical protein
MRSRLVDLSRQREARRGSPTQAVMETCGRHNGSVTSYRVLRKDLRRGRVRHLHQGATWAAGPHMVIDVITNITFISANL